MMNAVVNIELRTLLSPPFTVFKLTCLQYNQVSPPTAFTLDLSGAVDKLSPDLRPAY